ncbi:MAG: radical SAM family heme chaperone HemW [Dehalococcoidia bacterium]
MGLYLHVPFCASKCNYCDFNTYAGIEGLMPAYVGALVEEIRMWGQVAGPRCTVETIFFGGGTPSLLPVEDIGRVLRTCRETFGVAAEAEVTLESNPDDLTPELLRGLLSVGVNRLSVGVQSFHNRHLSTLTRRHSAEEAVEAYQRAAEVGFGNVNIDLMYGIPRQSMEEWRETLDRAMELTPAHLSLYALTLEEGTPLWRDVARGAVPKPDTDLAADMYLHAEEALEVAGYRHYEISNWALSGHECRHNLIYWRNQPYLGLGAGAHSSYGGYRFSDERSPRRYVERVSRLVSEEGDELRGFGEFSEELIRRVSPIDHVEAIDEALEMSETMMLGLGLEEGVRYDDFHRRFGSRLESVYGTEIEELVGLGLVIRDKDVVRLTQRGRLLGNEVFSRFLLVRT